MVVKIILKSLELLLMVVEVSIDRDTIFIFHQLEVIVFICLMPSAPIPVTCISKISIGIINEPYHVFLRKVGLT